MEFFPNLPGVNFTDPAAWAVQMESQGWDGICASDHLFLGAHHYPHVFVTAGAMAAVTSRIRITTSFCNNLFRSPVEFAQGALALQLVSNGRFEAGLGAGWSADEMIAMGLDYPPPGERVSRYLEALTVAGSLIRTGQCDFAGDFYQVSINGENQLGPRPDTPPPLVASAGGPRGIRESTPLVDRIEIKASARATRGGALDFSTMATVTREEVQGNVDRVRKISNDIPIGIFILVAVGDSPAVAQLKAGMGNGYLGSFVGAAESVAESLLALKEMGISRVQLTETVPGSIDALAPYLTA